MSNSIPNFGYGTGTRVAVALGIAGSAFLSGSILSLSFITAPTLLTPWRSFSPGYLAGQYLVLVRRTSALLPPLALIFSGAYGFAAYSLRSYSTSHAKRYLIAGLLTLSIFPYSRFFTLPLHKTLEKKASDLAQRRLDDDLERKREIREVEELVQYWALRNAVRGLLPLTSSIVGVVMLLF